MSACNNIEYKGKFYTKEDFLKEFQKQNKLYQLEGSSQDELVNKILANYTRFEKRERSNTEVPIEVQNLASDTTQYYYDVSKNKWVANRVTNIQQKIYRKGKDVEELKKVETGIWSKTDREIGTKLHNYLESKVKELAGNYSNIILPKGIPSSDSVTLPKHVSSELDARIKQKLEDISNSQKQIDPNGKVVILPEALLYSEIQDMAGTMDLAVVFSDASMSIFDYKIISMAIGKSQGQYYLKEDSLHPSKEESYSMQLGKYKEILLTEYGIPKVRQTRIIPFAKRHKLDSNNMPTGEIQAFFGTGYDILKDLAVAQETSDIPALQKVIKSLRDAKTKLSQDMIRTKTKVEKDRLSYRINELNKAIQALVVDASFEPLYKNGGEIDLAVKDLEERIEEMSLTELNEYKDLFGVYMSISPLSRTFIKDKTLEANRNRLYMLMGMYQESIIEELQNRIEKDAKRYNVEEDLLEPQRELTVYQKWMSQLSKINVPAFRLLYEYIQNIKSVTRKQVKQVEKEIGDAIKVLKDHYGSGDIYKELIDDETGNLIPRFKKEFWEQREQARINGDIKWFQTHYEMTDENKARFEKDRGEMYNNLEKWHKNKSEPYRLKLYDKWLDQNMFAQNGIKKGGYATKYLTLKNPESQESDAYKNIQKTPALKQFYDTYTKWMGEFSSYMPSNNKYKIYNTFVPNVHKDLIERLANSPKETFGGNIDSILNSIQVQEGAEAYTKEIDPLTGKPRLYPPILFVRNFYKNGKVDSSQKSRDLGRSMILFAQMATNYKQVSDIEDSVKGLRNLLEHTKTVLPKTGTVINESKNLDTFDRFTNLYLYGQTESVDTTFEFLGKEISLQKVAQKVLSGNSLSRIALNPISAIVGSLGITANAYMTGAEGMFYNTKQLNKSFADYASGKNKELLALFDMNYSAHRIGRTLSTSALSKYVTLDHLYIGQRKPDEAAMDTILGAMLQNYDFDSNGIIKRKNLIKSNSSLYERLSFKEGVTYLDGKELTDGAINELDLFRRKVRAIHSRISGQMSEDDKNLIGTTLLGRVLMQFRNWIPPMFEDRFNVLKKNQDLDEWEIGKYKIALGEIQQKGWFGAFSEFSQLVAEGLSLGFFHKSLNQKATDYYYTKYLKDNPSLQLTKEEFIDLRKSRLKGVARELGIISYILMGAALVGLDWDDEDEDSIFKKKAVQIFNKFGNELTFFCSPLSASAIIKDPFPILGYGNDLAYMLTNLTDEVRDTFTGEDTSQDKTPLFYYSSKLIPVWSSFYRFFDLYENEALDTDKGDLGVQLGRD